MTNGFFLLDGLNTPHVLVKILEGPLDLLESILIFFDVRLPRSFIFG
jgi:hypothetical protein